MNDESKEITIVQQAPPPMELTAEDIKSRVQLIQSVMKSVMKNETHYGLIPGCKEKSLYKAGSEVLLTTFRIAVIPDVIDLSTADEIRYRVKAKGIHQLSEQLVGVGVGECSSNEDKYKWRSSICDQEYNDTPETHRRVKYGRKKGGGFYTQKQIRTNPADLANTILKMAKKRAQIDLTLTATAASDIFTQDLEDMPEEYVNQPDHQPPKGVQDLAGDPEAGNLVNKLMKEAEKGMAALLAAWQGFTDDQRKQVGVRFGECKKIAEAANATQ